MFLEALGLLIVFFAVLFLAYVTTRFVAGKASKAMSGKHMEVNETINISVDKRVHLLRVNTKYFLISSSGKSLNLISEINKEDILNNETTENVKTFDFSSIFSKYVENKKSNEPDENISVNKETVDNNIKRNLFKIRNMMDEKVKYKS